LLQGGGPSLFDVLEILGEAVTIRAPDNSIIYANRAAREDMGFESVEELRSRNPRALMDDYIVTDENDTELHMDDLPSVRLLRGEPAEPLLLHSVSRSGGHVGWRLLKAALLRGHQGEVIAAVTVIENVTAAWPPSCRRGRERTPAHDALGHRENAPAQSAPGRAARGSRLGHRRALPADGHR
jgi:PAS domain-containing protein